jgi:hypothetical protein
MTDPPDDLAGVLRPVYAAPDPTRQAAVLRQTAGILRRRGLFRRGVLVAGAVVLFAVGGVVGWVVKPTPTPVEVNVAPEQPSPPAMPSQASETKADTAEELELRAELADDPADATRLFREAGDRFLTDRDYDNAARCYRRHLSAADAEARKVSADDSWLLLSLKSPLR